MADHTSRPVAASETVGHDGQLVRGRAAREGFEAAVDELDLVDGYIDIDIYTHRYAYHALRTDASLPLSACLLPARMRMHMHRGACISKTSR